uniref:Thioredoxin domain-containing protein n=1 Tax=Timema bartmani TaxID=61472 RepID=A0A7R9EZD4_9NEOP|nr:unnamed protein product [Timema bartmani]
MSRLRIFQFENKIDFPYDRFGTSTNLEDLTQSNSCLFISQLEEKRQEVVRIPNEYRYVVTEELGCTNVLTCDIKLLDNVPSRSKPYYFTPPKLEVLKRHVEELRRKGIIRDSRSPYTSPAFLVSKHRLVVDNRKPPKTSKSPTPVPFFPQTSLVADYYQGHIGPPFERVAASDISFIMYYAPWDAESQATRSQFKLVAQYYYKQVYFAAINCWQPLGECKQQFAKVQHFPVLIVYTQLTKGIQYKGVKEATHMIHFLSSVLHPVEKIDSVNDIVQLMNFHDAVVIGCFDFKGNLGGQGYHTFYTTSLKLLEKDPYREIGFGVITNVKVANELGIHLAPTIRLYLWNETLEYGSDEPYTPEALTKWVVANAHQVSVWLSPPGIKSLTLSPYVEEDSVMILFTPRNLLYTVNYNYNLLREVGQEYYNCDDNPWVKDFVQYLGNERAMSRDMYTDFELQCSQWREKVRREELTAPPIQVVSHFWANGSCSGRRRCKMCSTCSDKCLVNTEDVSKDCKCGGGPGFDSYPHQQVCWKQTHHGSNVGSTHPPRFFF